MLIEVDERVAQALKTLEAQAAARQMPLAEMLDLVITTTLGVGSVAVRTSFAENHAFFQDQANSPEEPTRTQWMRLGEATLEFWNDPKEDIYSETDGEPV